MLLTIVINLGMALLLGILTYLILVKKKYTLINGYKTATVEDQQTLEQNGVFSVIGWTLLISGLILVAGSLLIVLEVPFSLTTTYIVFVFVLFAGFYYAVKLDKTTNRKRNYLILSGSILFIVVLLGFIGWQAFTSNELSVNGKQFTISGSYGDTWPLSDIQDIKLIKQMPEIEMRTNGIGMETINKGHFKIKDLGKSLLYIHQGYPPFLQIRMTNGTFILINSVDNRETQKWFEDLQKAQNL